MRKYIICIFLFFSIFAQKTVGQIIIDPSQTCQTIDGFSASDCWTGNYVGTYWNESSKNTIAKYLFSQNIKADGSPEGIGLSMWRFNLGAGTAEQGDLSDISDLSRRAECFLDNTGTNYDWTKQAGQQWFLKKAKEYGCEKIVAFSNSPLVFYTKNGKGYSMGDGYSNLREDKYDAFAEYLATVAKHFKEEGIDFDYISPVNEPQWDWNAPSQEGSPWQNNEIKKLTVALDNAIQKRGLDTKILLAEAGAWNYLYQPSGRASNQIYEFFDRQSANYIGDLPSVAPVIGGHSYWTHTTNAQLQSVRSNVKTGAKVYQLNVFQTEWSMLDAGEGIPDIDNASYIDIALFMAKIIHSDLAFANVSSWSYWTSMDMERWGHKDRFLLVALAPGGDFNNPITESGIVYDRSTLWALGNYSFFIRPGYQRIQLDGANDLGGLMGTAYIAPDHSRIVAVYVNMAYETKTIKTTFQNMQGFTPVNNKMYVTNSLYNMRKSGGASADVYSPDKELSIPSRSVVTIVYDLKSSTGISIPSTNSLQIYPNPVLISEPLNIRFPEEWTGNVFLSVYSVLGHLEYTENQTVFGKTGSISLPQSLNKGLYILNTQWQGNNYYNTFLIK
jgi:O-glycosyl hydrolase